MRTVELVHQVCKSQEKESPDRVEPALEECLPLRHPECKTREPMIAWHCQVGSLGGEIASWTKRRRGEARNPTKSYGNLVAVWYVRRREDGRGGGGRGGG